MNKRGQIFLIATIVIIVILVGLGTVYNSASTKIKDNQVYDLSKELNYESGKVLEYGKLNERGIETEITRLAEHYLNSNPDSDINIAYGNSTEVIILTTSDSGGSVSFDIAGNSVTTPTGKKSINPPEKIPNPGRQTTIIYKGKEYKFDLKEGENFFFVISKNKGDEQIVAAK